MRTKKKYIRIAVTKELHKRLIEDRDHFQKVIGGGKWSLSDTITEHIKLSDSSKK